MGHVEAKDVDPGFDELANPRCIPRCRADRGDDLGQRAGSPIGDFRILRRLGAGGMGEVYRARDTRLERSVAIKVLPAHLAENPELRQRLVREAKAVSSLSPPNICPLYDIGH